MDKLREYENRNLATDFTNDPRLEGSFKGRDEGGRVIQKIKWADEDKILTTEGTEHTEGDGKENNVLEYYSPTPTGIEWADMVINICVGCLNGCHLYCWVDGVKNKVKIDYCYAADIMKMRYKEFARIEGISDPAIIKKLKKFEPYMYERRLNVRYPGVSKVLFVDSMSDWHYWDARAKAVIINDADDNPQHEFVIMSKVISAYDDMKTLDLPSNIWLGYTATDVIELLRYQTNHRFENGHGNILNLEPYFNLQIDDGILKTFDGVILGGMRSKKSVDRQYGHDFNEDLFGRLVSQLVRLGIPFFLKPNLWGYVDKAEYLEFILSKDEYWERMLTTNNTNLHEKEIEEKNFSHGLHR